MFGWKKKNSQDGMDGMYVSYSSGKDSWFGKEQEGNSDAEDLEEEEEYIPTDIVFYRELKNGALIFNIVDKDESQQGHVVVSPEGIGTVIKGAFWEFDDDELQCLKKKAELFWKATQ